MNELGALAVLPSLLAIVLAVWTRQVFVSLIGGIWLGCSLLAASPVAGLADSIDRVVAVLSSAGDARVIIFTLCVGGFIALIEASGGVRGFVNWLEHRRWANSPKQSQWLAWMIGVFIFIESNITVLVAGTTAKPLFDRFKVSREKLAYIIDSTSAPICILIPFNAWGAFNLGLLDGAGVEDPLSVFISAVLLNLYAITAVVIAALVITFDINIGPMAKAEALARASVADEEQADLNTSRVEDVTAPLVSGPGFASNMLLPILVLVLAMPLGLWITGKGDLIEGSGSTSVLWAVLSATLVAGTMLWWRARGAVSFESISQRYFYGAGKMVPVALILMLALALGAVSRELQAGAYIASLVKDSLPMVVLAPVLFLIASAVAFAIGSSWGTFALMIPLAVQASSVVGIPVELLIAAVLSGGVFGDHASPISDTTVIASMAADVDHIEHVRTQLPYALIAGVISVVGFFLLSLFMIA